MAYGAMRRAKSRVRKSFANMAKYTAGEYQYLLVNQYIEVMAKTRQWRPFKKGVLWACYLGVSVRWLREDKPTTDNLKRVYELMGMKQMNYPVL